MLQRYARGECVGQGWSTSRSPPPPLLLLDAPRAAQRLRMWPRSSLAQLPGYALHSVSCSRRADRASLRPRARPALVLPCSCSLMCGALLLYVSTLATACSIGRRARRTRRAACASGTARSHSSVVVRAARRHGQVDLDVRSLSLLPSRSRDALEDKGEQTQEGERQDGSHCRRRRAWRRRRGTRDSVGRLRGMRCEGQHSDREMQGLLVHERALIPRILVVGVSRSLR